VAPEEPAQEDAAANDEPDDPGDPVVLRMASPYYDEPRVYTPPVFDFVDEVEQFSGGNLRVEMVYRAADDQPEYSIQPDGEQQVVRAIADGQADLAWAGTRVFDTFGLAGFRALHAPLLVDSYGLQAAILDSEIPDRMLTELEEIDVVGLGVLAGGLRKPVGVDGPLLGPDDYAGITFQLYRSDVQADTVTALGATPSDVVAGARDDGLRVGEIDGHEHGLLIYAIRTSRGLGAHLAPYVTANVSLWPETIALLANPDSLASLTDTQAGWLREAAARASSRSAEIQDMDADLVADVCEQGARFAEASEADLAALRAAVEPVYAELAHDDTTAGFIAEVEALKESVSPEPLAIPDGCTVP
jgi:TRAP-type C4-dicarboxylate transport system substrate-binding protein